MNKRNADLDFFKFLYAWIIVLFHLTAKSQIHCVGGFYGVDFFLLVAGLFFFQSYEKQCAANRLITPGQYLKKRFLRFFPWSMTAFLFAFVAWRIVLEPVHSVGDVADAFSSDIWEILMVKWCGINEGGNLLNGPAWTLSAMCIVGFFLWSCLYYWKDKFLHLVMPLTLCLGYALWRHLESASFDAWVGFTAFGTLRAWLVMSLGYYALQLTKKLRQIRFNRWGKLLLTAFEIGAHVFILLVMFRRSTRYYQWLCTLLFLLTTAIAVSGHSYLNTFLDKCRFTGFLGELSFSVFLIHAPLQAMYVRWHDVSAWSRPQLDYLALVLAAAVAHLFVTKAVLRLVPHIRACCKRSLTEK